MSAFPAIRLKDLVLDVSSWNPLRADGDDEFQYIDLSAVNQNIKAITGERTVLCSEAPSRARQVLKKNDVLVSTVRPNLNAVALVPENLNGATASTGFCVVRANPEFLLSKYLFHWVKTDTFVNSMVRQATGASYPAISDKIVLESKIPAPSLVDQTRIAAILDQADFLRAKRREGLDKIDSLTQSIFFDMFGDPIANSKSWPRGVLGEHTAKMGSGSTPTGGDASYKESGVALIRSLNVHDGKFKYKNLAFIDEQQAKKLANVKVEPNDILLNITGASVARVCRAPEDVLPARVNQHVMIIRPGPSINNAFLERLLLTSQMKNKLLQIGGAGATREAITKAQAEDLLIICPPIALQKEFEQRLTGLKTVAAAQLNSLRQMDDMFASLQHRAFRGEL